MYVLKNKILLISLLLCLYSSTVFAQDISVSFSIGKGTVSSDVYLLNIKKQFDKIWLQRGNFIIRPSLGITGFSLNPKHYSSVQGVTFAGGLTFTFDAKAKTYAEITFGPTYISDKYIGDRELGSRFQFATNVSFGFRFGKNMKHSLGCFLGHYSHAKLANSKNDGFNMYGIEYRFVF